MVGTEQLRATRPVIGAHHLFGPPRAAVRSSLEYGFGVEVPVDRSPSAMCVPQCAVSTLFVRENKIADALSDYPDFRVLIH